MPIIASAKKALRQNIRRRKQNAVRKEAYKKAVRQYKDAIKAKKGDEATALLVKVYQTLDKAAKTGAIKKNKANRLKSRLAVLAL